MRNRLAHYPTGSSSFPICIVLVIHIVGRSISSSRSSSNDLGRLRGRGSPSWMRRLEQRYGTLTTPIGIDIGIVGIGSIGSICCSSTGIRIADVGEGRYIGERQRGIG